MGTNVAFSIKATCLVCNANTRDHKMLNIKLLIPRDIVCVTCDGENIEDEMLMNHLDKQTGRNHCTSELIESVCKLHSNCEFQIMSCHHQLSAIQSYEYVLDKEIVFLILLYYGIFTKRV